MLANNYRICIFYTKGMSNKSILVFTVMFFHGLVDDKLYLVPFYLSNKILNNLIDIYQKLKTCFNLRPYCNICAPGIKAI